MVKKENKINSPRILLRKKLRRDVYKNIPQFLALIIIVMLGFTLYFGLASNYRSIQKRVDNYYKKQNLADHMVTTTGIHKKDKEALIKIGKKYNKEGDNFIKNRDYSERLFFQAVASSPSFLKDGELKQGFSFQHNIFVTDSRIDKETISKGELIEDENRNIITNPKKGAFLTASYFMDEVVPVGSTITLSFMRSSLVHMINKLGLDVNLETGIIKYNDEEVVTKDIIDKIEFAEDLINANHKTFINSKSQNILTKDKYLDLLRKIFSKDGQIIMDVNLAGYVRQPESLEIRSQQSSLYLDYSLFKELLIKEVRKLSKDFLPYLSLFSFVDDIIRNNKTKEDIDNKKVSENHLFSKIDFLKELNYYNELDNFFTPYFYNLVQSIVKTQLPTNTKNIFLNIKKIVDDLPTYSFYNQFLYKIDNKKNLKSLKNDIKNYYNQTSTNKLIFNHSQNEFITNIQLNNDVKQARQLTYVFPMIFFLVSILVFLTTTMQIILRERTQIGSLKAQGLTTGEIFSHYLSINLLLISIGFIIGVIVGPFTLPMIMNTKYKLTYLITPHKYCFPYIELLVSFSIIVLVVSLMTYLICRRELKIEPAILMRPKVIKSTPIQFKKIRRNKNFMSKVAFRNLTINWVRSLMTIIGIMGCGALLLTGTGIKDTIMKGINHDMSIYFSKSEFYVNYDVGEYKLINKVKSLPEVKNAELNYSAHGKVRNPNNNKTSEMLIMGYLKNSEFYKPPKDYNLNKDEILLSEKYAKQLNVKVGDNITFEINQEDFTMKVKKIVKSFFVQGILFNLDDLNNYEERSTSFYVKLEPGVKEKQASDKIKKLNGVGQIVMISTVKHIIDNVSEIILLVASVISTFAIALALTVLYNLVRLNLEERRREIATLKVLGFSRNEIGRSILIEILFLTILGIIFGSLLGYPMLFITLYVNRTELVSYMYTVAPLSYLIAAGLIFVLDIFLIIYMTFKTDKIKMVESLKSVE